MEKRTRAASFCSSHTQSNHLPSLFARSFANTQQHFVKESSAVSYDYLFFLTSFPYRPQEKGRFTLSISLPFDFISSLLLSIFLDIIKSLMIKKSCYSFFQLNIILVFSVPDRQSLKVRRK